MFEKLGGRKFVMSLCLLIAGIAIELRSPTGMSTNMVGFMLGILATFSASNVVATLRAGSSSPANEPAAPVEASQPAEPAPAAEPDQASAQALVFLVSKQHELDASIAGLQTAIGSIQKTLVALLSRQT
jgi:hypothetical protein